MYNANHKGGRILNNVNGCRTFPRHASSPSDVSPSWSFPPRTFPHQDVSPSKTFPRQVGLSQRTFPRQRRFPTNHWGYGQNVRWSICPGQNVRPLGQNVRVKMFLFVLYLYLLYIRPSLVVLLSVAQFTWLILFWHHISVFALGVPFI